MVIVIPRDPQRRIHAYDERLAEQWEERAAWAASHEMGRWADSERLLSSSVARQIEQLRAVPVTERLRLGREAAELIPPLGDQLLFGDRPDLLEDLARVIAVLAYQPGGVFAFGRRWCAAPVDEAVTAEPDEAPAQMHPGEDRRQLLVEWVGEGWTKFDVLLGEYRERGWSEDRLDVDLGELRARSVLERDGELWRRVRAEAGAEPAP